MATLDDRVRGARARAAEPLGRAHLARCSAGPRASTTPRSSLSAEQFFALLAAAERGGDLDDPVVLQRALETVQPQADAPREQGIEIMTMHRAKGLEFDTVVLLGLAREPRPDEPQSAAVARAATADGRDDLIMVPAAFASDPDGERLADFVRRAERERDAAERARLLYVATTRARERLHVVWQLPMDAEAPPASSLLAHLVADRLRDAARGRAAARAEVERRRDQARAAPARRPAAAPQAHSAATSRCAAQRARSSSGPARPRRTSAPSFIATCSASRSRGSSVGARNAVVELKPAFARELELLGVEAAERRERSRARGRRRCRARSPTRTAAGCSDRTRKRARSSG